MHSTNLFNAGRRAKGRKLGLTTMLLLNHSSIVGSITPTCRASTLLHQVGVSQCSSERVMYAGLIRDCSLLVRFTRGRLPSPFCLRGRRQVDLHKMVYERVMSGVLVRERFSDSCPTGFIVRGGHVCARGTGHTS